MIPKHRTPPPLAASNVPADTPPIEHFAVDFIWTLRNGQVFTFSIVDGYGSVERLADRWIATTSIDRTEIMESAVMLFQTIERTWSTEPAEWSPLVMH